MWVKSLPINQRYLSIYQVSVLFNGNIQATARYLWISYNTVATAIAHFKNGGDIINSKVGRRKKYETKHLVFIESETINNHFISNQELANLLIQNFPELDSVCANTVMNARHSLGFNFLPPRSSVKLTEHAKNIRIQWANFHLRNGTNFKNVVFSDESLFQLYNGNRWLRRRSDDYSPQVCSEKVAHPPKVMIWGAIGYNFKSNLIFVEGPVNTESYVFDIIIGSDVLNGADKVYGHGKWVLQQDNARPHIANETYQLLDYFGAIFMDDWSPYSPDLNIIETIWAIMKRRLEAKKVTSIEQLKEVILDVWNNLSLEIINRLIESMPKRLKACVSNQGNTVLKY